VQAGEETRTKIFQGRFACSICLREEGRSECHRVVMSSHVRFWVQQIQLLVSLIARTNSAIEKKTAYKPVLESFF
jgi:hypothetical protein